VTIADELLKVEVAKVSAPSLLAPAPCDIAIITKTFFPSAVPEMILPHAPRRLRYFIRTLNAGLAQQNSIQASGSLAAGSTPGTIATMSLPPGTYNVAWILNIGGVPTAADANDAVIQVNGSTVATAVTSTGSTANFQQQSPFTLIIPPGPNATVTLIVPAAGSGAASWRGQMVATAAAQTSGNVILAGSNGDAQAAASAALLNQNMAGTMYPPGIEIRGEGTTELWVVSPFTSPAPVSVISEYKK
jgi:hypothetical protein